MGDKVLRQSIIDELDFEPSIDAADIGVAVDEGVVTLTGHVPTYAQKYKAEEVVKKVRGVRAIAQEIEVRLATGKHTADDEIAKRALSILDWDVSIPKEAVQVKVAQGWVTLSGEVDWQYQRRAAEDNVHKLSGVLGVVNLITLRQNVQAADIKKRIEEALRRNAQVEAQGISIDVHEGKVTLEGMVHTWHERDMAETAAWAAPGVKSVEDHLRVG
ncbi:MAG TPA: BON domain-containing protein [Beijerinckia sp.]|nr:BON domain-containing protein [Beijerinckia sp.]